MANQSFTERFSRKLTLTGALLFILIGSFLAPAAARLRGHQGVGGGEENPATSEQPKQEQPELQQPPAAEQAPANVAPPEAAPADPLQLVRTAVYNELQDNSQGQLFSWKERKKRGRDLIVEHDIQTPQGVVSRVMLINEKPLNAKQQQAEEERIQKATQPERMQRKQKEDRDDDMRTHTLLSAIPDAFDFTYLKTETASNGHKFVTLKFTPRPEFNPPNHETMVFTGMEGELVVDATAGRLAKVDGTLFQDVSFGWGILGRLYKGGRFVVEKAEVTPKHWDTTRMYLHFDGKVLFFKSLHIEEDTTSWDFQPVHPMTVAQALDYLNHADTQSAMAIGAAKKNDYRPIAGTLPHRPGRRE